MTKAKTKVKTETKETITPPAYKPKYTISTSGDKMESKPLRTPPKTPMPRVFYMPEAYYSFKYLVEKCATEVGWLGLVEETTDGDYIITDIYVPKQEVHGAETDILPEDMIVLHEQIEAEGKDPQKLLYWGHSHVNMGVNPSGQDERQIEEYLEHVPFFIRGIYNKSDKAKVDVFDTRTETMHLNVQCRLWTEPLSEERITELDNLLQDNVRRTAFQGYGGVNGKKNQTNVVPYGNNNVSKGSGNVINANKASSKNEDDLYFGNMWSHPLDASVLVCTVKINESDVFDKDAGGEEDKGGFISQSDDEYLNNLRDPMYAGPAN